MTGTDGKYGNASNAASGTESSSAGGPDQSDKEHPDEGETEVKERTPSTNVADKLGDFGQGSREQTQGGRS